MERFKMDRLMENMWWTIKRLAKAGNVIAPNVIRIPNNMGHVFNGTWDGKSLIWFSVCKNF